MISPRTALSRSFVRFLSFTLSYAILAGTSLPTGHAGVEALNTRNSKMVHSAAVPPKAHSAKPAAAAKKKGGRRDGELLVQFRASISDQDRTKIAVGKGTQRKRKLRGKSGIELLQLSKGQTPEQMAQSFSNDPGVAWAEPNYILETTGNPPNSLQQNAPNDPQFAQQWSLSNTGQNGGKAGSDIGAMPAWQQTTGSQQTVIAVIDSGIDFNHPDLAGEEWTNTGDTSSGDIHGWDYVNNSGTIIDENGHGTAVAGIIAASGNNGEGIAGVMWQASLMSLRVLDTTGTGDIGSGVEAIDYAVAHGAEVINLSWGTDSQSQALQDAITRAGGSNVVVVCSAGNDGVNTESTPYYPASYGSPNLLAVAATDNTDQLAPWSNWGPSHVVAAPGVDILTTQMGGGYQTVSGTSAAAPLVSGLAGLMKTLRPWMTASDLIGSITDSERQVQGLEGEVANGGVVNAGGAFGALRGPSTAPGGSGNSGSTADGSGSTPPSNNAGSNLPNLGDLQNQQSGSQPPVQIHANALPPPTVTCDTTCGGETAKMDTSSSDPYYVAPRSLPKNSTGVKGPTTVQNGVNLGSQNFNWDLPLLDLPGRAGLDLGITLSYNSLVWTKNVSTLMFNADNGFPGPGFQVGFPKLQQNWNPVNGPNFALNKILYVMVLPTGDRIEFQYSNTGNGADYYYSIDNSHMQLLDYISYAVVKTADGTQYTFSPAVNSEEQCTQIKDRNGNYITINYGAINSQTNLGRPTSVVDTLGRTVNYVYDVNNYLTKITQTWNGVEYDYAKFTYGALQLQYNFGKSAVLAPTTPTIPVLQEVQLPDQSYYVFSYTTWGQVYQITRYMQSATQLSYSLYNLPGSPLLATSQQADCPRFTERHDWVQYGVMNQSTEVVTKYNYASDSSSMSVTYPDSTFYREYYATTGWQTGLTTSAEWWTLDPSANPTTAVKKKWTTTGWTDDNTSAAYLINARPTEMDIYDDAGNHQKTVYAYTPVASYSLLSDTTEYQSDATTELRRTHIDYNLGSTYTNLNIIGLVGTKSIFDYVKSAEVLISKIDYQYDWATQNNLNFMQTQSGAANHDDTNFGASFIAGRANLCSVRQWNANAPTDSTQLHEQQTGYNTTGSPIFTRDALGHQANYSFTDNFSDGVNHNSFAYPTTVTDPDGFSSKAQYNYDFGGITSQQTPLPNTTQNTLGPAVTTSYDSVGRVLQVTNTYNSAHIRYAYPQPTDTYLYVKSYSTIQDGAGEAYALQVFDGSGRLRAQAHDLPDPNVSSQPYSGVQYYYDSMGRVAQQSNPTETDGNWKATGDDAAAGWVWTQQAYDWKGRPTVTTQQDGSTQTITYGGCGCAGGEVETLQDERGRQRRLTTDIAGRLAKTEELNFDATVYSTTTYSYNALDQATSINQQGLTRSFAYSDGYNRLTAKTTPEEGNTSYAYNKDDTPSVVTDSRGVTTTFGYNNRHLVTGITYGVPQNSAVATTANVAYTFDATGNRLSMTDGMGGTTYQYDSLSRLTSETRTFSGLKGSFALTYGVASYQGVTSYAKNVTYRAFGAMKGLTYGNGKVLSMAYDNRLRTTEWDVSGVIGSNYQYQFQGNQENTFRVKYAQDRYNPKFDRSYDYDQVGRISIAHTGTEARADLGIPGNNWGIMDGSYSLGYNYHQWR